MRSASRAATLAVFVLVAGGPGAAEEGARCAFFCAPKLKLEPTLTVKNLFGGPRVLDPADPSGAASGEAAGSEFEITVAIGVPTSIPRVGFTLEVIWAPFARTSRNPFTGHSASELGRDHLRDNALELETELNLTLLRPEDTGGWVEMHFDVVDKLSPAERAGDTSAYTHKLNLELDTAFRVFHRLPEGNWLRNVELEVSLDWVGTGLPKAGDRVQDVVYLDDASAWSFSLLLVLPIAPLFP